MIKLGIVGRGALAVVVSLLVVGTAFAASAGLGHPAVPSVLASPPAQAADKSPKPSKSPEATETPEPSEAPDAAEPPEPPDASSAALSSSDAAPFVARLKTAGITVSASDFAAMAAKVGVGGAVRLFAFAKQSSKSPADILAMFQGGQGWGQIAHTLGLNPGIGWIMSGGHGKGQGNGNGNGPAKTKGSGGSGS